MYSVAYKGGPGAGTGARLPQVARGSNEVTGSETRRLEKRWSLEIALRSHRSAIRQENLTPCCAGNGNRVLSMPRKVSALNRASTLKIDLARSPVKQSIPRFNSELRT